MRREVEKFLRENIEGEFKKHGGGLLVEELQDGILKVKMQGSCVNCPSAILEIENFVFNEVKEKFPEIKKIVVLNEISDDLINFGKKLMNQRRG